MILENTIAWYNPLHPSYFGRIRNFLSYRLTGVLCVNFTVGNVNLI